ncbi:hypothetical protein FD755_008234, partial [Muntiacus reevesi]
SLGENWAAQEADLRRTVRDRQGAGSRPRHTPTFLPWWGRPGQRSPWKRSPPVPRLPWGQKPSLHGAPRQTLVLPQFTDGETKVHKSPSRLQDGSLKGPSSQDALMEVEADQVTPEPVSTHQSSEGTSARGEHQERPHRAPEVYRCERCPKTFRHSSRFSVHQKRHNNERTCICAECGKGFFQASDLHVHQRIHTGEKPFACSTCEMAFTHKTNLRVHERTHTGEKPYECSLCQRRFRQSSTYHRHLRFHQKTALKRAPH